MSTLMFAVRILICALMVMLFFASASHYKEGDSLFIILSIVFIKFYVFLGRIDNAGVAQR